MAGSSDPIELELFKNAIFSIADEMALTVFRTTYSGVLKDNMDYSTGFADADGKLAAQGLTLPGHLGSVPTAHGIDHAPLRRRHGAGRRLHHERPVRRRHAPARHLRLQAALSRGRAAGLRLHGLPPHRRRRPRRRLERLRLDRDLRRGPAHRADEALRGGQAQQDHHDVHREERARCRCRCSATCAPSSPPATSPRSSSPSWSRATAPEQTSVLHAARSSTMPSA